MNIRNRIVFIIGFISIFVIGRTYTVFNKKRDDKILIINHEILYNAKIIKFREALGSTVIRPEYSFNVNDSNFSNEFMYSDFCTKLSKREKVQIRSLNFHVIYLKENPKVNRILLKKSDFKKYNEPYPDSLSKILDYYFECDE